MSPSYSARTSSPHRLRVPDDLAPLCRSLALHPNEELSARCVDIETAASAHDRFHTARDESSSKGANPVRRCGDEARGATWMEWKEVDQCPRPPRPRSKFFEILIPIVDP